MYSSIAMKPCGELLCSAYELCMPHDMQCYPCDSYCDSGSHNFDRHYCQNHCQDFIRDKMQTVGGGVMGFFNVHSLLFTMFCLAIIIFLLVKINKFMEKNDENPEVENGITSIIGDEENNLPCKSDIIV